MVETTTGPDGRYLFPALTNNLRLTCSQPLDYRRTFQNGEDPHTQPSPVANNRATPSDSRMGFRHNTNNLMLMSKTARDMEVVGRVWTRKTSDVGLD